MEELGFSFSLQQVNLRQQDVPFTADSLDDQRLSLDSVVDPNTEFQLEVDTRQVSSPVEAFDLGQMVNILKDNRKRPKKNQKEVDRAFSQLQQVLIQRLQVLESEASGNKVARSVGIPRVHNSAGFKTKQNQGVIVHESLSEIYPDIPPEVASYVIEKDPSLLPRLTAALQAHATPENDITEPPVHRGSLPTSFQHMADASEMFALKVSDLGRTHTNSAPDVNIPNDMSQAGPALDATINGNGQAHYHSTITRTDSFSSTSTLESDVFPSTSYESTPVRQAPVDRTEGKELHKYPQDRITILVEKKSYLEPQLDQSSTGPKLNKSSSGKKKKRRGSTSSASSTGRGSQVESPLSPKHSDRLETSSTLSGYSSNIDLDSNYSERLETLSNFSDVSGYEEEMFRIKKLLLDPSCPVEFPRKVPMKVENRRDMVGRTTKPLSQYHLMQLEEEYGSSSDLRRRLIQLQQEKQHLEGQLESMREELHIVIASRSELQVQALTMEKSLKARHDTSAQEELEVKVERMGGIIKSLNAKIQDAMNQLENKDGEIHMLKEETADLEAVNERLRVDLEQLKVDSEAKDGAVQGLKGKIATLHVEAQNALRDKLKAESECDSSRNECASIQKSRDWYQEQMHVLQATRSKLQQELMASQSDSVTCSNEVERLKSEIVQLNQQHVESQQRAVKEKESLLRHLETIEADMQERQAMFEQSQHDKGTTEEAILLRMKKLESDKTKASALNFTLEDLQHQLNVANGVIKEKTEALSVLETERADMLRRITTMQKSASEKELMYQALESKNQQIEANTRQLKDELRRLEETTGNLREEKVNAELALVASNKEKQEVDAAVEKLHDDFARISSNYQKMKRDLAGKEKVVSALEHDKSSLSLHLRSSVERISTLEYKLASASADRERLTAFDKLEQTVEQLRRQNKDLGYKIADITQERSKVQKEKQELREKLDIREQQLLNQHHGFEASFGDVAAKDQQLGELMKEKNDWQDSVSIQKNRVQLLQQEVETLMEEKSLLIVQLEQVRAEVLEKSKPDNTEELSALKSKLESLQADLLEALRMKQELNSELRRSQEECRAIESEMQEMRSEREHLHNVQNGLEERLHFMEEDRERDRLQREITVSRDEGNQIKLLEERYQQQLKELEETRAKEEVGFKEKQAKYESNIRVLLKKLKEHMKARKSAEKQLNEMVEKDDSDDLRLEIQQLRQRCEELETKVSEAQQLALDLEKAKGKLTGALESHTTLQQRCSQMEMELSRREFTISELNSQLQDLSQHQGKDTTQLEEKVRELEDMSGRDKKMIRDLRQQIFSDKRDNSHLKKQVYSLKVGLDTANQLVESKKQQLIDMESQLEQQVESYRKQQEDFQSTSQRCDSYREDVEALKRALEQSKANDPMMADQLKTLGFHLHQKNQELANIQAQLHTSHERREAEVEGLRHAVEELQEDLQQIQRELEDARQAKFSYQSQVAELRGALKSSVEQNKLLKMKLEVLDNSEIAVDLLATLPTPTKYDDSCITQLLEQSSVSPRSRPLSDLKNCVNSLKREMETLQKQLKEKSLPQNSQK